MNRLPGKVVGKRTARETVRVDGLCLNARGGGRTLWTAALLLVIVAWCLSMPLGAHEDHDHGVPAVPDEVIHKPTAVPDRIVLSWSSDPASSQAVTWRTDDTVTRAVAQLALAGDGPKFVDGATTARASLSRVESDLGWVNHLHSVNFRSLAPATKYAYRVGDRVNWSEWNHFTTASDKPEGFTFVYFGDAQNDVKSQWSRVVREAFRDAPRAAFFLHAGDLINRANRDAEWGEWHEAGGFIHRTVSCIATPGNHEYDDGLSKSWRPGFMFPKNGPDGLEETVFWIDYQCARIISLNSNEKQQEQVAWLEDVLSRNDRHWTILTFHHPMYSSAEGRDNEELREMWMPIFDKYKVDLVLQGHDHTYSRSRLLTLENVAAGAAQRSAGGTMYVVSVSGPKMYELGRRPFVRRAAQGIQLYQVLQVAPDRLRYEARTATGRLYDGFTLIKQSGVANQLVERVPDTPEHLGTK